MCLLYSDSKTMRETLDVRSFGDFSGPTNATALFAIVAADEVGRYSLKVL